MSKQERNKRDPDTGLYLPVPYGRGQVTTGYTEEKWVREATEIATAQGYEPKEAELRTLYHEVRRLAIRQGEPVETYLRGGLRMTDILVNQLFPRRGSTVAEQVRRRRGS